MQVEARKKIFPRSLFSSSDFYRYEHVFAAEDEKANSIKTYKKMKIYQHKNDENDEKERKKLNEKIWTTFNLNNTKKTDFKPKYSLIQMDEEKK